LNPFYGAFASLTQRNLLLLTVAVTTILSEFLPILLANIPFSLTQTKMTHVVCARAAIAILGFMIIVLGATMFVKWPHMAVDPRTVAGAVYYVADSAMLADFEGRGISVLDKRERDERVKELGQRYFYGDVRGVSGQHRIAVDAESRSS
jgi:hypothetical protein